MTHEILMAGFGGQGIMFMGTLLAHAGMMEDKEVTWMPSYGPEMRGGTANCSVVISHEPVASPLVSEPTALIVMNRPSLERFEGTLRPGGLLVVNTSLVDRRPERQDVRLLEVPANEMADRLGSLRVANMVVLGAFVQASRVVTLHSIKQALPEVLPQHRHGLIAVNVKALEAGAALASGGQ
jgi:2-oxoglutarate ferredoxin oxidoreductase subunit gamma